MQFFEKFMASMGWLVVVAYWFCQCLLIANFLAIQKDSIILPCQLRSAWLYCTACYKKLFCKGIVNTLSASAC